MDVFGNRAHTEIHGLGWSYLMLINPEMTIGLWVFPPCFRSAPGALQRLWWAERGNVHCNGALICLTCLEPIRRCPKMWLCTPESSILLFFSIINHPAIGVHLWSYEDLRFSKKNMCKSSSVCVSNLGILVSIFLRFPEPVTPLENTPTVTNY